MNKGGKSVKETSPKERTIRLLREIARLQSEEGELEKEIRGLKEKISLKQEEIEQCGKIIRNICGPSWDEFTEGKKRKKIKLDGTEVNFSETPWATSIKNPQKTTETLEKRELDQFISTKTMSKPDKRAIKKAILEQPGLLTNIEGISLTKRKKIRIMPKGSKRGTVVTIEKFEKSLS